MISATGNNTIDALAYSSWRSQAHTPAKLSYSFLQRVPFDASSDDSNGFAPMTAQQQQAVREAMAQWAAVANLTFTEHSANGDIQIGTNDQGKQSSGYAYFPNGYSPVTLYTNNQDSYNSVFTAGSYGPTVLLHELGHTLGLKHPGNYNSTGSSVSGPYLPSATDNSDYTVMAYPTGAGHDETGLYNVTPMLYDIQAIQYLYGANMAYHAGADTYTFNGNSAVQCVWDGGGDDTFDFSGCGDLVTIDLRAGHFSSSGYGYGNISIAYNVVIERAQAGFGGSVVYANDAGNTLLGGQGADTFYQGAGDDRIDGGGGSDSVVFGKAMAGYLLSDAGGVWTVRGEGSDVLSNVEQLQFADASVRLADLPQQAVAVADQRVEAGNSFSLELGNTGLVRGGQTLKLGATQSSGAALPAWLSFDADSGVFSGLPGAADVGVLSLRLSASNGAGVIVDEFALAVDARGNLQTGGDGNDTLRAGVGSELINGGGGTDTVLYAGAKANYTVQRSLTGFLITDQVGGGGVDSLLAVERVRFADAALAFDNDLHATQTYRLYGAAFGREPEAQGLGFYLVALDGGLALSKVAEGFVTSPEFLRRYGVNLSDQGYVTQLYQNVLHRAPEQAGLEFHLHSLAGGMSRGTLLTNFSESPEYVASLVGVMPAALDYLPYGA